MLDLNNYGITMWDDEKIASFRRTLLAWYDENKRDLPWRRTKNPYHIWVSEIMLQQTQVITVIPYYTRFLEWFPTISDLAKAPEEKILKAWEGLGYYSRVKNMQKAAQQVEEVFSGQFPSHYQDILSLKGIGPYTAGAIASIAFQEPTPAVDGNVMRVLARLFEVNYDIGDPKNIKLFQAIMTRLIDPERPGDFNQAFMDLGTDIESAKNPRPDESPIRFFSGAYLHGTMDKYPIKKPKKKPRPIHLEAFIIQNQKGEYLLEKNTQDKLLGGFWSFPMLEKKVIETQLDLFDTDNSRPVDFKSQKESFLEKYPLKITWSDYTFPLVKHVFSHQKWEIELIEGKALSDKLSSEKVLIWLPEKEFSNYPFATPQKKMWQNYQKIKQEKRAK
ncbi:A/G-specific adenine glycosylase [Streptococcus zalophi]|uniref:A/G-specific adenine glycosylase n=1 Tax=Streptococcus zalophi TaxID=640031 RepID=UPI00215CA357|nr:A/G-specific adenine glycosylase [Streptococcus zalophi]MCR8967076.1 A/G-specific adenine glycosylase [Streptococcus zalophi]